MKTGRKTIAEIDKNFAVEKVSYEGMTAYRLPCEPFEISGLYRPRPGDFRRLPHEVARQCNEPLREMYVCSSGGRIRFRTDSERIIIKCKMPDMKPYPHMAFTGTHCFDLYADGAYINAFRPDTSAAGEHVSRSEYYAAHGYDSMLRLDGRRMREIVIHFPLYIPVNDLWIALEQDATIAPPTPYGVEPPIVFYGTSITQGGCVSHAGNSYPALLSRWLDADFINLGFSDGGRGEQAMADYIASLPMSVLVLDFEANVSSEDYRKVLEPFFQTVRKAYPALPVILTGFTHRYPGQEGQKRWNVACNTYNHAVAAGDKHIWLVNAEESFAPYGGSDICTVDGTHYNDLGSWVFAKTLEKPLRPALGL